ncbi:hypothetical protein ID007_004315 [Salmonella enterica]|nr:hypothetical protein [Salmonella enterica]
MDITEIKASARGRWHDVLSRCGISLPPGKRHGECPICGGTPDANRKKKGPSDRFRLDDKGGNGTWVCSRCGSGDAIDLICKSQGINTGAALKLLNDVLGNGKSFAAPPKAEIIPDRTPEQRLAEFRRHYQTIRPHVVRGHCDYLAGKGYGHVPVFKMGKTIKLRLDSGNSQLVGEGSTLIKLLNTSGELMGVEYISAAGKFYVTGSLKMGAFHPVSSAQNDRYILAEGFATAYAVSLMFTSVNVLVAFDAGNMLHVARALREKNPNARIAIAGDNDAHGVGLAGALRTREALGDIGISIPTTTGHDWDNVYRELGREGAREVFLGQLSFKLPSR